MTRAPVEEAPPPETGRAAPVLEAEDLVRDYGPVRAVDGVSVALGPGELLSIFGPNGAGKSSLLRLLGGGLRPTSGEVRIGGAPLRFGDRSWQSRLGVLSHTSFLYGRLTAAENLHFYGRLYGLSDLAERVPARLESVGLAGRADEITENLSRGMRQRLAVARTLLHDPDIVLLDEPFTGLDVHAAALLRDVLGALRDGRRTVVLVTHNLHLGYQLADRIAIQVRGAFAHEGPREDLTYESMEAFYREVVEAVA